MLVRKAMALCVLALSTAAFGIVDFHNPTGTYTSGGAWKTPTGEVGAWTSTMVFTRDSRGHLALNEKLEIVDPQGGTQTEENNVVFISTKHGYFDVESAGKVIGNGYCFKGVCHLQTSDSHGDMEETFYEGANGWQVVGSSTSPQFSVAWEGKLTKK